MYNIYFGVAAIAFVVLLLIYLFVEYPKMSESNLRFRHMVLSLLISDIFDVATAITIDHGSSVPPLFNQILNTIFFIVSAYMALCYVRYIESFVKGGKLRKIFKPCLCIFIVYIIAMIGNFFFGYVFSFNAQGEYIHGPLYPISYGTQVLICIIGLFYIFIHRHDFEKRQKYALWLFLFLIVVGFVLQIIFFPKTLLAMYMGSLAAFIFLFVIETPDYHQLAKTLKELDKQKKRADEANKAKSLFLAKMSHEIRTPINAIIGMNEMILREQKSPQIQSYAMDIKSSAEALLSTINDILDLTKVESGKMELVNIEYEVSSLLHDVINTISLKAQDKNLEVKTYLDHSIPSRLYGDDVRIRQILINLLNNAVKYTEKGSISFSVTHQKSGENALLRFDIKDTGIGIRQADLDKLFAEFERIDSVRNRKIEGTGLGMNITQQLLHLMGSELKVESVYGSGSHFYFELEQQIVDNEPIGDLDKRIAEQKKNFSYNVSFIAPDANILIVDDIATNRKVCRALLKDTLVKIDEASSGYECLECVKEKHYDLIFLDDMMPDLDGVSTLKEMQKTEHACKDTPVVALTANAIVGAEEMYLKEGFNSFLSKPVRPEKLERMIRELLPKELINLNSDFSSDNSKEESVYLEEMPAIDGIDWDYARLHMTDDALLKETIQDFIKSSASEMRKLNGYFETIEDPDSLNQYRITVHAMKSNSAMIGATSVSGIAKLLERFANQHLFENIRYFHTVFEAEWEKLTNDLQNAFQIKESEKTNTIAPDRDKIFVSLKQLENAIIDCDIDIADDIIKQLSVYNYSDEMQKIFDDMIMAVENIDADQTTACIRQMEDLLS